MHSNKGKGRVRTINENSNEDGYSNQDSSILDEEQ